MFAEEYQIPNLSAQEKQEWKQRIQLKQENIVNIIDHSFFEHESANSVKKGRGLVVYTEVITSRWSEMSESEFDYEEQWLLQCLMGFQKLYQEYGGFKVKPSMVAITPKQKARVWINPNFLKNCRLEKEEKESSMVESIIKLFKKVNIIIPQQEISFKRMIEFMDKQTLVKSGLNKVRSKSDILYIDKLEFKK